MEHESLLLSKFTKIKDIRTIWETYASERERVRKGEKNKEEEKHTSSDEEM